jgi:aspartate aminotransferase
VRQALSAAKEKLTPSMQATTDLAERISLISESSTMKVAADADRLRREGKDVVDFGAGEPDFPTPENIKQAAIAAIDANFTKYTPTGGTLELKNAICDRHRTDYGTNYSPAECMVTVGGKHAIFNLMQAVIGEGDEVIIPVPYWVTYKDVVNYAGGKCVFVPTDEANGFTFTADLIAPYITSRSKLLIINSPNNPSGAVLSREEFEKIYRLAAKRGVRLMTDECYCQFLYDDQPFSIASMPDAKEHVVVAGSLSKTYAMTGWRIGFALAPKPLIDAMMKLQSHTTSNPTSVSQKAAIEALRGPQDSIPVMLAEYRTRRDYVVGRLREIPGVRIAEPKGAFYAYPNISIGFRNGITSALQFAEKLLAEEYVAVVPGEAFGTSEHVRISYATSLNELGRGLDRIERFIRER